MQCQCDVCSAVMEELRSARLDPATIKTGRLLSMSEAIVSLPRLSPRSDSYQVFNVIKGSETTTLRMELKFSPQPLPLEDDQETIDSQV